MRMRADASAFDPSAGGELNQFQENIRVAYMTAARDTLEQDVGEYGKEKLRAQLRNANLGGLEKSWQDEMFPAEGLAWEPVVEIYSKASVIVQAFAEGATIKPTSDGMLAIPIPGSYADDFPNPRGPDDKVDYARRVFGDRLFVIPANGQRPAILAARMVGVSRRGRLGPRRLTKRGNFTQGTQTAMLFFLVPQAQLPKLFDYEAVFDELEARMSERFQTRFREQLRAAGIR